MQPPTIPPLVSTGYPVIDQVLSVLGALYALLTIAATFFPKGSPTGQVLAKVAGDLKGHLTPAGKAVELSPGDNVVTVEPAHQDPEAK